MRGLTAQAPQPVLHVLKYRLDAAPTTHVVAAILNNGEIAEPPDRGVSRGAHVQATAGVLAGPHLDMELHPLADFVGDRITPEQRAQSGDDDPNGEHRELLTVQDVCNRGRQTQP